MDRVVEFARRHGLLVFEDCAQSFAGDGYVGHPESDVSMISFGPIKTCSTIMGGILRFKDSALAGEVERLQSQLPYHSRWDYFGWLIRFAAIKTLSSRILFTLVLWIAKRLGTQDMKLNDSIRVFGGQDEVSRYRQRPSYPTLALLEHRLKWFDGREIARRNAAAEFVLQRLPPFLRRPGESAPIHNHWIFPVEVSDPKGLMKHLRALGFDSINGYSSFIIPEPPSGFPDFRASETRRMMERVIYLPVHAGLSRGELTLLAQAVSDFENLRRESRTAEPPTAFEMPMDDEAAIKIR
jgi:dTDP-4-amino-4,6-dideoxygalactose transaminase